MARVKMIFGEGGGRPGELGMSLGFRGVTAGGLGVVWYYG